jgi:serine-type D-Ala-D-Ala carboxypeptidase/endopeptidase
MRSVFLLSCSWVCLNLPAAQVDAASANAFSSAEMKAIDTFIHEAIGDSQAALVVGLVDETGERVFSAGTLNNRTDQPLNGDSVFFIGSVSKTFTALLLLEMADRKEVQLDDPVAKYLPASVSVPTFDGEEITLMDLATQSSGLPFNADNMTGAGAREEYESYTIEKMYDFLGHSKLDQKPGTAFAYSNVGMALLGHALERRAGDTFESLVRERICQPLGMDSTCITLTPEQTERLAVGSDEEGDPSMPWKFQAYHAAGDIHSTANDLLTPPHKPAFGGRL